MAPSVAHGSASHWKHYWQFAFSGRQVYVIDRAPKSIIEIAVYFVPSSLRPCVTFVSESRSGGESVQVLACGLVISCGAALGKGAMKMRCLARAGLSVILGLLVGQYFGLRAQQVQGSFTGTVRDQSGALIPGVSHQ